MSEQDPPLGAPQPGAPSFRSSEVQRFWPYIQRSVDRIVGAIESLDAAGIDIDWRPPTPHSNSAYVMAVHALGNLDEQLLGLLSSAPSTRDRDAEFLATGGSTTEIQRRWRTLRVDIHEALQALSDADLDTSRRHPRRGVVSGHDVLILVARHMAEHAGQAELTRDLAIAAQASD